jgi:hypothetical protein
MEKHYVSWWSVGGNIGGLILTFTTLNLSPLTIVVLSIYATIGIVCALNRWRKVYVLFGSKTYGSALFVLGLFSISGADSWLNHFLMSFSTPSLPNIALFLLSWLFVAIISHVIGYFVRGND